METIKSGCVLVNGENGCVALIYRDRLDDITFPKGHLEAGESISECAIRETAEETKRVARILDEYPPYEEKYTTPRGEKCVCYFYLAVDEGKSDNDSLDTHDLIWVEVDKVEERLSYPSQKKVWQAFLPYAKEILEK